jgi:hypothetical protein
MPCLQQAGAEELAVIPIVERGADEAVERGIGALGAECLFENFEGSHFNELR